jgi:hypothetical protein
VSGPFVWDVGVGVGVGVGVQCFETIIMVIIIIKMTV